MSWSRYVRREQRRVKINASSSTYIDTTLMRYVCIYYLARRTLHPITSRMLSTLSRYATHQRDTRRVPTLSATAHYQLHPSSPRSRPILSRYLLPRGSLASYDHFHQHTARSSRWYQPPQAPCLYHSTRKNSPIQSDISTHINLVFKSIFWARPRTTSIEQPNTHARIRVTKAVALTFTRRLPHVLPLALIFRMTPFFP